LVVISLLVGLVFGYAMKNSGLWLAKQREKQLLDAKNTHALGQAKGSEGS